MKAPCWRLVTAIAEQQDGLIGSTQLKWCGVTKDALKWALGAGVLTLDRKFVYAVAGIPPSIFRPLRSALIAAGEEAAASFLAAAWVHGSTRVAPGRVEITLPTSSHRRLDGTVVHRTAFWTPDDVVVVNGIRVTTPARTLADLALGMNPYMVGRIFDEFIRLGSVDAKEVLGVLDRLGRRHKGGSLVLQRMAVNRYDIAKRTTELESRMFRALVKRGVPKPTPQVQVVVPGDLFVVDWGWVPQQVALETHGLAAHGQYEVAARDANRRIKLRKVGWELFEAVSGMDIDELADAVQGALEVRTTHPHSPLSE